MLKARVSSSTEHCCSNITQHFRSNITQNCWYNVTQVNPTVLVQYYPPLLGPIIALFVNVTSPNVVDPTLATLRFATA